MWFVFGVQSSARRIVSTAEGEAAESEAELVGAGTDVVEDPGDEVGGAQAPTANAPTRMRTSCE
jgi:hypothetical protein